MASPVVGARPKYPYAAFISYNRGADLQLSADLQSALQQFAKPWYRLRALRVFRDVAALSANAAAWPAVAKALDESEYLILLASPEAAASVWCKKEIEHWLATKPRENILLAITGGEIAWDSDTGDFDWSRTTALPEDVLRGTFTVEPNYIDLRPVKAAAGSGRSKVLRALVADLAAPLHHRPKDDLVGEEFRVRRRARLTAGSAIVALIGLTVTAGFFAVEARVQANSAEQRRAQAEEQRRLATARQFAAQSQVAATLDARTALRMGLAADTLAPGPESQANLVNLLANTSYAGELGDHKNGAVAALFTPDGHTLVTADLQGGVFVWDATDLAHPRRLGALPRHESYIMSPVFHRDGHTIAFSSGTNVELWDLADPRDPRQIGDPLVKAGASVMFSPDGRLMVTSGTKDKGGFAWDVSDLAHPRLISELALDDGWPLALMPDGRTLIRINEEQEVSYWDVADIAHPRPLGVRLDVKNQHYPNSIVVSPDGRTMAAVDTIHGTRLYDVSNPRQPKLLGTPLPDLGPEITFSPDSQSLAASTTNRDVVVLLNLLDREHPTQIGGLLVGHGQTVWQVNFSPDGRTLATASADGRVDLWNLSSRGRRLGQPVAGGGWAVAISPQGTVMATVDRDDKLRLFDLTDPTRPREVGMADGFVGPRPVLSFSADGQVLAVADDAIDGSFRLYDVSDPSHPRQLASPGDETLYTKTAIAFSPKGRILVVGSTEGSANLWDIADPAHPRQVGKALTRPSPTAPAEYVTAVAFSSDGHTVAVAYSGYTLGLWDVTDPTKPQRLSTLTGHVDLPRGLAFSPDGGLLASVGRDANLLLWNVKDPAHPQRLGLPLSVGNNSLSTVAFSPDGRTVAATDGQTGVMTWDVTDPAHPFQLGVAMVGQTDAVLGAVFSHDGRVLISSSLDGTLVVWDQTWVTQLRSKAHELACTYAGGGLDRTQWTLYAGGLDYVDSCRS